ncbi:hypothetical protein GH714_012264 [Hevea brasiliensis]|uniref:Anthocyanidin 3-O-glucosyltransferase n=1 Tax=Hevea brasiliensis TaxID=3981 RepID=A0A6A6MYH5_HEVBR|nr:hypothetical protein GH714_012264 [Hevea brasiliensis]
MAKQAKACSGIIWNSFEELERDALTTLANDFVVPMFLIGPFHKHFPASSSSLVTQDRNCISWLDTQAPNSVLYVSFGSIAAINEAEFQEIAWGLANSKQPFLWVVRPGLVNGSEWLEPLPDGFLEMTGGRGLIVKWAPQQEVLAHPAIGGFWTHNGWNSTLEGLCEGVPMICLPNFGDQLINARYVSNVWRVGIHLENNLDRGNIESAIKRLMVEAEGQELRIRTLNLKDSQLEEPVPELPPLKVKDLPGVKTRDVEDFYHLLAELVNETKASSGLIWNSFEDLEQVELSALCKDFPIPIFTIGPFHKYFPATSSSLLTQDKSCISWLDKKAPNSVLYVSFGSIAEINEAEFLEIAWGLANSNQPFLWVVRPGLVLGSEWIEPLPHGFLEKLGGRGCIVKWAPQQEVLAHPAIGGFWTHNGWNSTLEGICEGVPMICHPIFGDQRVNARYVADIWRIGLHLEYKLERGVIERAIKRLLVEAEGQEMRKRIMTLKEKVEHCLKQGGSSYESLERLTSYILSLQPLSSH